LSGTCFTPILTLFSPQIERAEQLAFYESYRDMHDGEESSTDTDDDMEAAFTPFERHLNAI